MPINTTIQSKADKLGSRIEVNNTGCYCDGVGPMSIKELKAFLRGIEYERHRIVILANDTSIQQLIAILQP